MKKALFCMSALAFASALSACGTKEEPANNIVAEDINEMTNMEAMPPAETAANVAVEAPAAEQTQSKLPAPKPAAPAKPATTPAKPANDTHAGHDMNNMDMNNMDMNHM